MCNKWNGWRTWPTANGSCVVLSLWKGMGELIVSKSVVEHILMPFWYNLWIQIGTYIHIYILEKRTRLPWALHALHTCVHVKIPNIHQKILHRLEIHYLGVYEFHRLFDQHMSIESASVIPSLISAYLSLSWKHWYIIMSSRFVPSAFSKAHIIIVSFISTHSNNTQ